MATEQWVESAAAAGKAPQQPSVVSEAISAEHLLSMPRLSKDPKRDQQLQALEADAARLYVRRLANRHGCGGMCGRPEHARDVAAMAEVMDALFGRGRPRKKLRGGL